MPKVSRGKRSTEVPLAVALEGIAVRTRVRDDGSSWFYAVLACLGHCDHAQPAPFNAMFRRQPSVRDMQLDHAMRRWLFANRSVFPNGRMLIPANVLTVPNYSGTDNRSFFGSYGFAEWATDAFGVHLIRCDELGGLEDHERVKAHIIEHQRKFPMQPLVVVADSQDIECHLEAYVVINQPRYELPGWLTTCAEDILSWLLLWPREYEDASSHAGAREDGTFMVDTIIGWRFAESGAKEFLVRWVGWEDCTWEPQDNVPPALWLEGHLIVDGNLITNVDGDW